MCELNFNYKHRSINNDSIYDRIFIHLLKQENDSNTRFFDSGQIKKGLKEHNN